MTTKEAIDYIENYTWSTTRLGLDRTRSLLRQLGDPQKELKFIHVAGSNGKGSTCAMLESILRTAGFRTGLYTSPYIQDFCERIRVGGENIPGDALAAITERVRDIADAMEDHPSQFELVTAIAMVYFREAECDLVVLEVGMGGALDSTNVIDVPEVAVITNLGLEHTEYLGKTLSEITAAKAGIIKPGCSVVAYPNEQEVQDVIEETCRRQGASLRWADFQALRPLSCDLEGQRFSFSSLKALRLPLLGEHQLKNAAVVLTVIDVLREKGWAISEDAVRAGLERTQWPARFEVLHRHPLFILDGGHNPQCAEAIARNLAVYLPGQKVTFLMGVLADKDYSEMLSLLEPFALSFVCVTPDSPRALPAAELAEILRSRGQRAEACGTISEGIDRALESDNTVIAFGSLYLAGEVRTLFPKRIKRFQKGLALSRRDAMEESEREKKSGQICRHILASERYASAKTIFLFRAFRSEADLRPLSEQAKRDGKRLFYPYCGENYRLYALCPDRADEWQLDDYGIEVPSLEGSTLCPPEEIDLVLCPCTAFDRQRHRLGMGAGYYDRYLPQCTKAAVWLIAFEAQCLPQVYTDRYDVKMDALVTENGIFTESEAET